jgi:predicted oxidoreductase
MERIELAEGLAFSRLVYGMWRLADDGDTSVKHVDAKINAALDQGITTFDQADIYGGYTAEAVMGTALKANPPLRQHMEIVSKCDIVIDAGRHSGARVKHYDTTAEHINASVDASLSEMGID